MSTEFGLMAEGQEGVRWEDWLALAAAAERGGFDGLYTSDHYLSEAPRSGRAALDAWGVVCALAAVTERIRLGTVVSPATFRHPSVLAKLAATADHVSGGRVDVALGTGWHRPEHRAYGFSFPRARTRMDVLEEQVEILCRSWADGEFSFTGIHYELERLDALPKPVQRPRPRLVVGGSGGPRGLALAGRWADEYNSPHPTDEQVVERRAALARAFEAAGRDPATARFSVMMPVLTGADRGEVDTRVDAVARLRAADGRGALPDTWIVGTAPEVAERLRRLVELGVDRVILEPPLHTDIEMVDLLAAEVLPAVRSA